ncbi:hypothetical protein ACHAXA_001780 [Cyclostephanos tholiformis]|uniref:Serine aminopeptidase S33 domain-containing protein n=1 Tax=Cyclostephanos tholiformis TaxID=382380 RepID=A0ABD3RXP1_9STRA
MFPRPRINGITILVIGFALYAISLVCRPLLLALSCVLAVIVPYSYRENDDALSRRILWTEFLDRDDLPRQLRESDGVTIEEGYWINRRGMALMTSTMTPETNDDDDDDDGGNDGSGIRAVVCLCHGYMDNVSFLKRIQFQRFARRNIAVCMIEYEGHGRSDGINALIPRWENLVEDAHDYFRHVTREKFPNVRRVFLMGESMGGAVAYDIMSRHRDSYDGAIFAAPMVKILVTPPPFVVALFERIVGHPGTLNALSHLPWAPSRGDMPHLSFKDKDKMRLALMVPTKYGRKPRFATARELLNATRRISSTIHEFDAPFIVLHGLEDMVTDPRMSEMLYNESRSSDKTIKLYRGMYHNLTTGETDENIDIVFNDAISWVTDRSKR